jgi:hypothetical protein
MLGFHPSKTDFTRPKISFFISALHVCVNAVAEYEESIEKIFGDEIDYHRKRKHKVFVKANVSTREPSGPQGGKGSEYCVISRNLQHSDRNVCRGTEGKLSVKREIPKYRKHKSDEI